MKPSNGFHRLHALRMENDAAGYRMDDLRPRFERLANRDTNGTATRAVSAYQLFQTPPDLAARMVEAANFGPDVRLLEPSAGLGRLLDAVELLAAEVVAVEVAAACTAELYRQEREGVTILQRNFLDTTPAELGTFDAVLMNPPFHLRDDVRHILHARTFLRPGGTLCALCLDTHHREAALRPLAATWEKIPAGIFRSEGTKVATVLLTIKAGCV